MIYSIGYQARSWIDFADTLEQFGVKLLVDVRSKPYSRNTAFNQRRTQSLLFALDIAYVFEGRDLGGIQPPQFYRQHEGKKLLDSRERERDPFYNYAIHRLEKMAHRQGVAMMCLEAEPKDCHRGYVLSETLRKRGVDVWHIMPDNTIHYHDEKIARR